MYFKKHVFIFLPTYIVIEVLQYCIFYTTKLYFYQKDILEIKEKLKDMA